MSSRIANCLFTVMIFVIVQAGMMTHVSSGYSQQTITPLVVAQDGLKRLTGLIASKKLDQNWAETFTQVRVSMRNIKGFAEYVVDLTSASGSPATVTFYYNMNGGYDGSNLGN